MSNDSWRTPPEIFDYYNLRYDFQIDVCASEHNALCEKFYTEEDNCLSKRWRAEVEPGDFAWCNPPHSNPLPFIIKALDQSRLGIGTVFLLNHDMSVEWSKLLTKRTVVMEIFTASGSKEDKNYRSGRVAFLDSDGLPKKGNSKSQFICVIPPFVRYGEPITTYIELSQVMDHFTNMEKIYKNLEKVA